LAWHWHSTDPSTIYSDLINHVPRYEELRAVHDNRREILANPPQLHQSLNLAHLASMIVLSVFRYLIRDIYDCLEFPLVLL